MSFQRILGGLAKSAGHFLATAEVFAICLKYGLETCHTLQEIIKL